MYLWNEVPASSSKKKTSATCLRSCLSLTSCYSPQILKRNIVCLLLTISISARIRPKVTEKTNLFSQSFGRGQFLGWRELERAMTFTSHKKSQKNPFSASRMIRRVFPCPISKNNQNGERVNDAKVWPSRGTRYIFVLALLNKTYDRVAFVILKNL